MLQAVAHQHISADLFGLGGQEGEGRIQAAGIRLLSNDCAWKARSRSIRRLDAKAVSGQQPSLWRTAIWYRQRVTQHVCCRRRVCQLAS